MKVRKASRSRALEIAVRCRNTIGLLASCSEPMQVAQIIRLASKVFFNIHIDILQETTIVEAAIRFFEMASNEVFVKTFFKY